MATSTTLARTLVDEGAGAMAAQVGVDCTWRHSFNFNSELTLGLAFVPPPPLFLHVMALAMPSRCCSSPGFWWRRWWRWWPDRLASKSNIGNRSTREFARQPVGSCLNTLSELLGLSSVA